MSERPRLLLHAGVHYTGAGHVQRCLGLAQGQPGSEGWTLPFPEHRGGLARLLELHPVPAAGPSLVVLDQTLSGGPDPELIQRVTERFDCRISLFLLRQDWWLEYHFVHRLRHGERPADAGSFSSFANDSRFGRQLDYKTLLDSWSAQVGRANLATAWVSPGMTARDLTRLFQSLHDLAPVGCSAPVGERYLRPPWPIEVIQLATLLKAWNLNPRKRRILLKSLETLASGREATLGTAAERAEILARFAESNRQVTAHYQPLGGENLTAATDDGSNSGTPLRDMEPEEFMAQWTEPLLGELARRLVAARRKAGQNSESMDLLLERREEDIQQLEREIVDLETKLSSPAVILRHLWRRLSSALG